MTPSFHLLLGRRDWRRPLADSAVDLSWDERRGQVTLRPELLRFPASSSEEPYTPDDRRGAAADRFGHIYWIGAEARSVHYQPAGGHRSGPFWTVDELGPLPKAGKAGGAFGPVSAAPATPPTLRGLGVTGRGYLVVGTLEPAGLLVFDLHGGGPPRWHHWPGGVEFAPFDMSAAADGGLWILGRRADGTARLWYLDCALRVATPPGTDGVEIAAAETDEFRPRGGSPRSKPARFFSQGMPLELASPAAAATPVSVVALPDGSVLILDLGPGGDEVLAHRLCCGEPTADAVDLNEALHELLPDQPPFAAHDMAFLPHAEQTPGVLSGVLYVASHEGNQSFAFTLTAEGGALELTALSLYLPMRRYAGKALVAGPCEVYYDQESTWFALTALPRPRYVTEGRVEGLVLDGKEPDCVWHRLFIDGCIPAGDAIEIESRAADDREELGRNPWRREPDLFLRRINRRELEGESAADVEHVDESELPHHRPFASDELAHGGVGTWELLFQNAIGRFVELRITLRGSGRSTPKIRSLRVYYPRFSYRDRFLPATYREDPVAGAFLDRLLANFEGFYTELDRRIGAVEAFFDSRTVPEEALDWLAGWLGAALDDGWDEARRRLFIAHAVDLYRQRGTPRGLERAIRLSVDPCPDASLFAAAEPEPFALRVSEHFRGRRVAGSQLLTGTQSLLPGHVASDAPWEPAHGGARLHRLYQSFLVGRYGAGDEAAALAALNEAWGSGYEELGDVRFAPLTPAGPSAADRRLFLDRELRLPYADVSSEDADLYRDFLARLYGDVGELDRVYGLTGSLVHESFDEIVLPTTELPADGQPLADWFQFAAVELPLRRNAHRFTVLVPVEPETLPGERQRLLERVAAVTEREKPSHTQFDVQLYWALFRVGTARVGLDTLVGEGSRFTALILGSGYVGEGLLGQPHPWNVTDRFVSGRDGVGPGAIG